MSRPPETVYFTRRTVVWWCFGLSALWACILGLFYVGTTEKRMEESARFRAQARGRAGGLMKLRAADRSLNARTAKLIAKTESLLAEVKSRAPPEIAVEERLFPLGKAEEIVPGQLFLTVGRLDNGRARPRLAAGAG